MYMYIINSFMSWLMVVLLIKLLKNTVDSEWWKSVNCFYFTLLITISILCKVKLVIMTYDKYFEVIVTLGADNILWKTCKLCIFFWKIL